MTPRAMELLTELREIASWNPERKTDEARLFRENRALEAIEKALLKASDEGRIAWQEAQAQVLQAKEKQHEEDVKQKRSEWEIVFDAKIDALRRFRSDCLKPSRKRTAAMSR